MFRLHPFSLCFACAFLWHRACGCQPAPGLPLHPQFQEGEERQQSSGATSRENVKSRSLFDGAGEGAQRVIFRDPTRTEDNAILGSFRSVAAGVVDLRAWQRLA